MSEMKLHEAIRLGAMLSEQGFDNDREPNGPRCAIAAAADAIGGVEYLWEMSDRFPVLERFVEPPPPLVGNFYDRGNRKWSMRHTIWALNDHLHWTREQIADWVQTIEEGAACDSSAAAETETVATAVRRVPQER